MLCVGWVVYSPKYDAYMTNNRKFTDFPMWGNLPWTVRVYRKYGWAARAAALYANAHPLALIRRHS